MLQVTMDPAIVEVLHVTIQCRRPFDPHLMTLSADANTVEIAERRTVGPKLWLFETFDHEALIAAEGYAKKANPARDRQSVDGRTHDAPHLSVYQNGRAGRK